MNFTIKKMTLSFICSFFLLFTIATSFAQPTGFIDQEFVGGFEQAVGVTFDANGRMYVWEKQGKIWIVENGVKSSTPLLDISEEVGNWRDFGMLGVALDPDFLSNGNIYLLYIVDRHHLLNFGTNNYDADTDDYFDATIGRITRYTAEVSSNYTTVDYSSRQILLGTNATNGFPSTHQSHGTGHLVFGTDGTLMASLGDGASYSSVDQGSASETYYQQAITDGIISSAHNVGAYRSQILNNYAGKILRIDPETGAGIPSNPYYQTSNPNSRRSKVWARGLRNPCRFTLKPETGSHDPADGDPGVFYVGDVGWGSREELNVVDGPGLNFGWPKYEGMTYQPGYNNSSYTPSSHELAKIDWRGGIGRGNINGTIYNIGSSQLPGDNVSGNCSMGGTWYDGTDFPIEYQNTYFHADYSGDWIMNFKFDANDNPTETQNFKTGANSIVFVAASQFTDGIFYIAGAQGNSNPVANAVRQITYTGNNNLLPVANLSANVNYGSSPLTVELKGSQSFDPDGDVLTYTWDFGDGTTSNSINPIHEFTSANSNPASFTVTLTVSDGTLSDQKTIDISLNNTPPNIVSTSINNTNTFNASNGATINLNAVVNDAEHSNASLTYQWFTELHHNNHFHQEAPDNNASTTTELSAIGCDGATYFYRVKLIVTDPAGLFSVFEKDIYPNCSGTNQTISFNSVSDKLTTDADFNLTATTNSGLPIIFHVVEGPATVSGNTVSLTGEPGEVWLRAIQSGNTTYAPAQAEDQYFQVNILSGDCPGLGSISREVWTGVAGVEVAGIPLTTTPNIEDEMYIFEIPTNVLDNYGTRLRGYLCPAVSGNYTFWIASDDRGELWLSTDDTEANKVLIANVPQWSASREWNKFPEQKSTTIALLAGQRYYVEALMKEGTGGDNLAVGWRLPDNTLERPVPQQYILPWDGGVLPVDFVNFTDQTSLLPNTDFHSGVAIGIADMNGDNKDDIVRLDDAKILNIEYQNAPNAVFSNSNFGNVSSSNQWSLCIGDADENGFNDILTGGAYDNIKLFKANGTGSNYNGANLPSSNIFIQGSNFADINNDGALDIFACHDDAESRKWENDGSGNFVLNNNLIPTITSPASDNSGNYASIWTDYDNDGDLDLYISKCRGGVNDPTDPRRINQLFQNDGNNTFTEVAAGAGLKIGDQTWSTDFADIDNDGDMDAFMLNHYSPSLLFVNNGNGTFSDVTTESGLDQNMDLFGIQGIFRDFDNDGFVDLVVTGTEHRMFKNDGDGTFTEIANPFTSNWMESLAIGDLNSDGFLDIYAGYANLFTTPSTIDDQLFMNQGNANNWIQIDLEGTVSNLNGIGARVELHGSWGVQIREVRSGEGYGIHNSFLQHFGIGSASQITKVVVNWPSGIVNEILNPSSNQVLTIIEEAPTTSCTSTSNLALGKPTSQSGTQLGAEAARAIDGDTNGNFWGGNTVTLTDWVSNAWWEIDLQNQSQIDEINLWNRTDCCDNLFSDFYIFVSPTPFTSTNLNTTLNQSGVTSYLISGSAGLPTNQAINALGRYVRVQLTGTAYLAIAEVEVIGCIDNGETPLDQTIAFDAIPDKITVDAPFNVSATATSGLPVSFTIVSGPATISNNVITLNGAEGTVVVRASQAGNAQFNPAQNVNQSFEVTEPQVGACTSTSNLALGKPATQAGTQLGAEASRAVDGNTNGNFWGGQQSVSLTNWTPNAWWEVDLQVPSTIETINLWNRTDCCDELFANYYVFVSDVPFASQNINTTLNQAGVSSYLQSGSAEYPTTINISRTGRYVRVQLVGTAYLAIAEVEVMGCIDNSGGPLDQTIIYEPISDKLTTAPPFEIFATASSGLTVSFEVLSGPATVSGNVVTLTGDAGTVVIQANQVGNAQFNPAPSGVRTFEVTTPPPALCTNATNIGIGKTATQSGTQLGATADRAIDGNTNGNFWGGQSSVTLTDWVGNAWWEIDLGAIHNIDEINLWNRTDCCADKFSDFYVFVSDIPFTSQGLDATINQAGVDNYYVEGEAGLPTELSIVRTGQYVRVQLVGTAYLAIAEVEIMGCTTSNLIDVNNEFVNETPTTSQASFSQEVLQAKVFPNPAEDIITVDFQTPTDHNLQVFVMDTKGSEVLRREFYTYAGSHSFTIDISKYPTGTYIVYLQHGEYRKVIQFVKL